MCYMDEEYPAWRYTMDTIDHGGCDADVLILGDSRAMADLIPEVMNAAFEKECSIENLAVGGATTIEMYYFLERYLENNKAPTAAIVMFAPFHYSYIDNYKTRTTYFNALKMGQYMELARNTCAIVKSTEKESLLEAEDASLPETKNALQGNSVCFDGFVPYNISARLRLPDVYLPAMTNARFVGRKSQNDAAYENLMRTHGQGYFGTLDGCDDPAYEASYTQMAEDTDARIIELYAVKLLDLLAANSIDVIVAQPPMNETTYDSLDAGYVDQYKAYITALCEAYDNVIFENEPVRYGNEYFGDSSHLNEKGAVKFSEEFAVKYKNMIR